MSLLAMPEELIKRIAATSCVVQPSSDHTGTTLHWASHTPTPLYTTDIPSRHFHIRSASKLFHRLTPTHNLREVNRAVEAEARRLFFADVVTEAMAAVYDSMPQDGIVSSSIQTHSMRKGTWTVHMQIHATITTVPQVPGWVDEARLHCSMWVRGTSPAGWPTGLGYEDCIAVPSAYRVPPAQRSAKQKRIMRRWMNRTAERTADDWTAQFGVMHAQLAREGSVIFPGMVADAAH
jgi:hypothetical protein